MAFNLTTEKFEGPLDLMLHLIKEQKLDIFDLDMEVLTDQYLAYLNQMEELKLEIESEYLVVLATLIEYKSKKLLPQDQSKLEADEEDPKEALVRRLLEYQQFKEVSASFNEAFVARQAKLAKSASYESYEKGDNDDDRLEGNPNDLLKAMNRILKRIQLSKPVNTRFTAKELSIDDRLLVIKTRLVDLPEVFNFNVLVDDCQELHEYIITFLALLDLAKNHILYFSVDNNDVIWLKKGELNGNDNWN